MLFRSNSTAQWQVNEVCLDLNAPLVGALGYILSKRAPVKKVGSDIEVPEEKPDSSGKESIIGGRMLNSIAFNVIRNSSSFTISSANSAPFKVQIFSLSGKLEQEFTSKGTSLNVSLRNKGMQIIKVMSKNATKTFKVNNY